MFPLLYAAFGFNFTIALLLGITFLASIEELIINIISKELNKNVKSIFKLF